MAEVTVGVAEVVFRQPRFALAPSVQDLHVTIINAATGEVLRDFTLDPTSDYQSTGAPKGPTRKKPRT